MLLTLLKSACQLLLPARCWACDESIEVSGFIPLCRTCGAALSGLMCGAYCPRCGRDTGPHTVDESGCGQCRGESVRFDGIVRIGRYDSPLKELIWNVKYHQAPHLGKVLGRLLSRQVLATRWDRKIDLVVPVPLYWRRRWTRGYDQARLIARALAQDLDLPTANRSLVRIRHTPQQVGLSMTKRWENVRGAFAVPKADGQLANRSILLVDDVMTSGATVTECTRTLKRAKVGAVYVAVAAVASHP